MRAAERRILIKEMVLRDGSVAVKDLSLQFGISDEVARRDLELLEQEGILKRNYGGATAVTEIQRIVSNVSPVKYRKMEQIPEKSAVADRAASYVQEGDSVFIDAGSTTWFLVNKLKHLDRLVVVTNSVDVVYESSEKENWDVLLVGGKLKRKSMCLIGVDAPTQIEALNVDISFVGTSGISLKSGFTSSDMYEAEMKKKIIRAAQKSIVISTHDKIGKHELHTFAHFNDVYALITSSLLEPALQKRLQKAGANLVIAPA